MEQGAKYLNLGCGYHFASAQEWCNIDFTSTGEGVLAYNLIEGVPVADASVDLVYHSHVLEHFTKQDGENFIATCFRVLKPGGVIRVAVPDLETIARNYLAALEEGINDPADELKMANYDWALLEMYDQTVRNSSGGEMAKYLFQDKMLNEQWVYERIGEEGRSIRRNYLANSSHTFNGVGRKEVKRRLEIVPRIKKFIRQLLLKQPGGDEKTLSVGKFRLSGEVHQWMYDRYSLAALLKKYGGLDIKVQDAFSSYVTGWQQYALDAKEGVVRKPDSLFMEAVKGR